MDIKINRPENFDIFQIFDCGQCFRFEKTDEKTVQGVAFGKLLDLYQDEKSLIFRDCTKDDYENIWEKFLSLDMDYSAVQENISLNFGGDETISRAIKNGSGIRILRQEFWETLCSFIISQNNNIPRIKKIISALCEKYGEAFSQSGKEFFAFPSAEKINSLSIDELMDLKMGFRAKYIKDAAEKFTSGEICEDILRKSDTPTALLSLCKIYGVGMKVASCVALFSLEKYDAFPVDVWVKRILNKYYSNALDISALGKYAGIAQQYLFYYERYAN